jgi:coenzyme F420 hydrogenase subunit beta
VTVLQQHPIDQIVARGQCMGCGFCAATLKAENSALTISMRREDQDGTYVPKVTGWKSGDDPGEFLCPGTAMDMPFLASSVWGHLPENGMLGETLETWAAHSCDLPERQRAASGGVVPALLRMLFDDGSISRAYVLGTNPEARDGTGRIITSMAQFLPAHGSHYHPFDFGMELKRFLAERGPFAFVGLPCQVAAMRQMLQTSDALREDCKMLISLFCGGINSFRGVRYYLERFGIQERDIANISYRDGDWPGRLKVGLRNGATRVIPRVRGNSRAMVMHYMAAFQGFWMLKRCRICPDQVGDFADIAVGDPHSRRFREMSAKSAGGGYSAVVLRSPIGRALFQRAVKQGYVTKVPMSADEVVESQGYTLVQRRHADQYAITDARNGGIPPLIKTYPEFSGNANATVRRVAQIDLMKLRLALNRPSAPLIWVWQTFEYLVLRFPLSGLLRRSVAIFRNR